MTKIKICGLKRLQDIEYVNELLPDFIGFVFAGTKRRITDEKAKELKAALNPSVSTPLLKSTAYGLTSLIISSRLFRFKPPARK